MTADNASYDAPGRSLVRVKMEVENNLPVLVCLCDCGCETRLTLEIHTRGDAERLSEFAYTCDVCKTAHWFKGRTR